MAHRPATKAAVLTALLSFVWAPADALHRVQVASSLSSLSSPSSLTNSSEHGTLSERHAAPKQALAGDDYWPTARGRVGLLGESPFAGPRDLGRSIAWEWHHPEGRYHTVTLGVVIDAEESLYLSADDAIRKLNKDGQVQWTYTPQGRIPTNPSLLNGVLYGSTTNGLIFAVDMHSGLQKWVVRASNKTGEDTGFVTATEGVVIAATDSEGLANSNRVVHGLRADDGSHLWSFRPDTPVWNFMALPAGDGTFVFQDIEGGAYRHNVSDGRQLWKAKAPTHHPGTHTDGSAILGPNGVVYTVALEGCCCGPCDSHLVMGEDTPGWLNAFRLEDGRPLWQQRVQRPPNVFPAVGRLSPDAGLSVVIPVGAQCSASQTEVYAFDAMTGAQQWRWTGPKNTVPWCAGDPEGLLTRLRLGIRAACLPNPWSAPTIDADGAVYAGNQNGRFYRIQDANADGHIGPDEVSSFDAKAAFSSPGSAHTPNMVAVASCDGLFAFRR